MVSRMAAAAGWAEMHRSKLSGSQIVFCLSFQSVPLHPPYELARIRPGRLAPQQSGMFSLYYDRSESSGTQLHFDFTLQTSPDLRPYTQDAVSRRAKSSPPRAPSESHSVSCSLAVPARDRIKDDVEGVVRDFSQQLAQYIVAANLVGQGAGEALELGVECPDKGIRVLAGSSAFCALYPHLHVGARQGVARSDSLELLHHLLILVILHDTVRRELQVD
jgi:hypothetical protein